MRYLSVAMEMFLCGPAAVAAGARLLGWLTQRLENPLELRAHRDAKRPAGRQLAYEPLFVDPRQLARLREPLETMLDQHVERGIVLPIHDPVRVVGEKLVEHREIARILRLRNR